MAGANPSDLVDKVVRIKEIPNEKNVVLRDSSFFKQNAGDLPSPDEIRLKAESNGTRPGDQRRPPVSFEEMGLIVKYGSAITIAEAQCLYYFNRHMRDKVPTPEVFVWCCDKDETFIYMQLIRGETLEEAWPSLREEELTIICKQLHSYVEAWRELRQASEPYYIGHIGRQGVGDMIFSDAGDPSAGPFADLTAFHDFFARYACPSHAEWDPRRDFAELAGLTDDRPVVFTHADLSRKNIMVAKDEQDPTAARRVVAVVDWHQSGWYPVDWEWLKAQWDCDPLEGGGGRDTVWLSQLLEPADEGYAYAWEYITSSL